MGKLGTEPYGFSSSLRWSMAFWAVALKLVAYLKAVV
jgi:hypothetical protein